MAVVSLRDFDEREACTILVQLTTVYNVNCRRIASSRSWRMMELPCLLRALA